MKHIPQRLIAGIVIAILASIFLLISGKCNAQDAPKYKYYFMMTIVEDKEKIAVYLEEGSQYNDLPDSIFMMPKGDKKTTRLYKTYSEIFTNLSTAGLEFVQMVSMPTSAFNRNNLDYAMWRKRVE